MAVACFTINATFVLQSEVRMTLETTRHEKIETSHYKHCRNRLLSAATGIRKNTLTKNIQRFARQLNCTSNITLPREK